MTANQVQSFCVNIDSYEQHKRKLLSIVSENNDTKNKEVYDTINKIIIDKKNHVQEKMNALTILNDLISSKNKTFIKNFFKENLWKKTLTDQVMFEANNSDFNKAFRIFNRSDRDEQNASSDYYQFLLYFLDHWDEVVGPGKNNTQNPFGKLKGSLEKAQNQSNQVSNNNNQNMGQVVNQMQQRQVEAHGPTVGPMGEEENDEDPAIYFLNCFDAYDVNLEKLKKVLGNKAQTTPIDISSSLDPVKANFKMLDNKINNHIMLDRFFQSADEQTQSAVTERIFITKQEIEEVVKDIDRLYDAPFELPAIRAKYGVNITPTGSDMNNAQDPFDNDFASSLIGNSPAQPEIRQNQPETTSFSQMSQNPRTSSDNNRISGDKYISSNQESSSNISTSKIVSSLPSDSNTSKIISSGLKLIVNMSEIELLGDSGVVGLVIEPYCVLKVGKQIFRTKRDKKGGNTPSFKESFTFKGFNVKKDKFKITIYNSKNCPKEKGAFLELKLRDITSKPEYAELHPLIDIEGSHAGIAKLHFKTSPDNEPIAEDPREHQEDYISNQVLEPIKEEKHDSRQQNSPGYNSFNNKVSAPFNDISNLKQDDIVNDSQNQQRTKKNKKVKDLSQSNNKTYPVQLESLGNKIPQVLTLKVCQAKMLKNQEIFGKMDPFCIIKLGNQKYQTTVQISAGKFPIWNETFHFTDISYTDKVNIEMYDKEDFGKDEFIGQLDISLQDVMLGKSIKKWFEVTDKKNKRVGEIELEFISQEKQQGSIKKEEEYTKLEFMSENKKQGKSKEMIQEKNESKNIQIYEEKDLNRNDISEIKETDIIHPVQQSGFVDNDFNFGAIPKQPLNNTNKNNEDGWQYMNVIQADITKTIDYISKVEPYYKIKIGDQEIESFSVKSGNKKPRWNLSYLLPVDDNWINEFVYIEVWDKDMTKDDFIGSARISINSILDENIENMENWFDIKKPNNQINGRLQINFDFCQGKNIPYSIFSDYLGTLNLKVSSINYNQNPEISKSKDLFYKCKIEDINFKSNKLSQSPIDSKWNQSFSNTVDLNRHDKEIRVEVYYSNRSGVEMLGFAEISKNTLITRKDFASDFPLRSKSSKDVGSIYMEVSFVGYRSTNFANYLRGERMRNAYNPEQIGEPDHSNLTKVGVMDSMNRSRDEGVVDSALYNQKNEDKLYDNPGALKLLKEKELLLGELKNMKKQNQQMKKGLYNDGHYCMQEDPNKKTDFLVYHLSTCMKDQVNETGTMKNRLQKKKDNLRNGKQLKLDLQREIGEMQGTSVHQQKIKNDLQFEEKRVGNEISKLSEKNRELINENIRKDQKLQRLREEMKAVTKWKNSDNMNPTERASLEMKIKQKMNANLISTKVADVINKKQDEPIKTQDKFKITPNNELFPLSIVNNTEKEKLRWKVGCLIDAVSLAEFDHFTLGVKIVDDTQHQNDPADNSGDLVPQSVYIAARLKDRAFLPLYQNVQLDIEDTREFIVTNIEKTTFKELKESNQIVMSFKIIPRKWPYNFPSIRLIKERAQTGTSVIQKKDIPLSFNKFIRSERMTPTDFAKEWDLGKGRIFLEIDPHATNQSIIKSRQEILYFFKKMTLINFQDIDGYTRMQNPLTFGCKLAIGGDREADTLLKFTQDPYNNLDFEAKTTRKKKLLVEYLLQNLAFILFE